MTLLSFIFFLTKPLFSANHFDETIRQKLRTSYLQRYPSLHIDTIILQAPPHSDSFKKNDTCQIRLNPRNLRNNHGSVILQCGHRTRFYRYRIKGKIGVYKAIHQIKKDRIITPNDTTAATVPFKRFGAPPLLFDEAKRYLAHCNIAKGRVLTARIAGPVPGVVKHERIRCVYRDGAVTVEFDATALQSGKKGDMITLRRDDGKTLRGVVVGKNEVEIR
ncbi:MAG: flagellar basal body P-ring formation protein FlgA [Epsilonproteobacteria bacterium]|nr:flagellar basal body P-ring formation protein FlgA [Campylobacterota bacterium]